MTRENTVTEELDQLTLAKRLFFTWYREEQKIPATRNARVFILPKKMTKAEALLFVKYLRDNDWEVDTIDSEDGPAIWIPVKNEEAPIQKDRSPHIFWSVVIAGILLMTLIGYLAWMTPLPGQ